MSDDKFKNTVADEYNVKDENAMSTVPMTVEEMGVYLRKYYGYPVVLRQHGTTEIQCPYCRETHDHQHEPGHTRAQCNDELRSSSTSGIIIDKRVFIPNYGYTILEYVVEDGRNRLI